MILNVGDVLVTHNCIIAMVQLFHPNGQEAKNRLLINMSRTVFNTFKN